MHASLSLAAEQPSRVSALPAQVGSGPAPLALILVHSSCAEGGAPPSFIADLYRTYRRPLTAWVAALLSGDRAEADDVVQDVFMRVARMDAPARVAADPHAFLRRVALNIVRDRARRAKVRSIDRDVRLEDLTLPSDHPSPESHALWRRQATRVEAVLAAAGGRVQQVVTMSCREQMTHLEIAAQLGVTTRTVERCMARARRCCAKIGAVP